jgi:hypothetical protein
MIRFIAPWTLLVAVMGAQAAGLGDILGAFAGRSEVMGRETSMDAALSRISAELNRNAPVAYSDDTVLDRVTAEPGHRLTYHYTLLSASREDIGPAEFQKLGRPALRERLCTSPEMHSLLRSGVIVSYAYRGKDGKAIGEAQFSLLDCASRG